MPHTDTLHSLTDRTTGRAQRRPEEKRARLLAAARSIFAEKGYGASVHQICRAAGVGIGTFYHQFPDKAELMRLLMDQEHEYRVAAFDALPDTEDPAAEVARILAGSDPALMRAMIEACGTDARLRSSARDLRRETQERFSTALARVREARNVRRPAIDASTAAWATLALGDAINGRALSTDTARIVSVIAFAETDGERVRPRFAVGMRTAQTPHRGTGQLDMHMPPSTRAIARGFATLAALARKAELVRSASRSRHHRGRSPLRE